jgi:hypothetical protein
MDRDLSLLCVKQPRHMTLGPSVCVCASVMAVCAARDGRMKQVIITVTGTVTSTAPATTTTATAVVMVTDNSLFNSIGVLTQVSPRVEHGTPRGGRKLFNGHGIRQRPAVAECRGPPAAAVGRAGVVRTRGPGPAGVPVTMAVGDAMGRPRGGEPWRHVC